MRVFKWSSIIVSFNEILKPTEVEVSPHLSALDIPGSFDDGVIIGTARLNGTPVHIMAQEGQFMGGAVGEIHGAKIVGLLHKAIQDQAQYCFLSTQAACVRMKPMLVSLPFPKLCAPCCR